MSKTRRRRNDEDNDEILRDGESLRVSLTLMDSWQQDMVADLRARHPARLSDGELAQHRPGYRVAFPSTRDTARDAKAKLYNDYDREAATAYQTLTPAGAGEHGPRGAREGDTCTINGNRGRLKMVNGRLQCVAVPRADAMTLDEARADRALAYQQYDVDLARRWMDGTEQEETNKRNFGQKRFRVHLEHKLNFSERDEHVDAFAEEEAKAIAEKLHPDYDVVSATWQMGDAKTMLAEHRRTMDAVYSDYEKRASEMWRSK